MMNTERNLNHIKRLNDKSEHSISRNIQFKIMSPRNIRLCIVDRKRQVTLRNNRKLTTTQSFEEVLESVQPMISSILTSLRIYKDYDYYRQVAAIAVWKAWLKADPSKGQLSGYIYSAIKGELLNALIKEKNYVEKIAIVDDETLDFLRNELEREKYNYPQSSNFLEGLMCQFKQVERSILYLYYVEDLSDQDIANLLGFSVEASKKRRQRIIKKLRNKDFEVRKKQ